MEVLRPGESLKQCRARLMNARAQAIRAGQPHHKLDKKIEYVNRLMSTEVSPRKPDRPSPSKYASHAKRFTRPLQGGGCTPK